MIEIETKCSSFHKVAASNMDAHQQNEKDVSKVFNFLRSKLNAKEKELLELQRAEPCLLAPDWKQIETIIDAISSLHLSTQEGLFLFASKSVDENYSSTPVYSTGVDAIRKLPSTVWLSKSKCIKSEEDESNQYRLPMVTHLLSLPMNAFIASSNASKLSTCEAPVETKSEPVNRLPMVSQLLSMPMSAFKSSSNIQSMNESSSVQVENTKKIVNPNNNVESTKEVPKSILATEEIYSKEHWLRKSSSFQSENTSLDLDKYIEQTSEKMRRLHTQYLEALEKLKTPSNPADSSETLKSMYPKMFDRIKQDISTENITNKPTSNK